MLHFLLSAISTVLQYIFNSHMCACVYLLAILAEGIHCLVNGLFY